MEISNRIVQLLQQHISQTLDAAGRTELNTWAAGHPAYRKLLDEVTDEAALKAALHDFHMVYGPDESASIRRMEQRIAAGIGLEQGADPRKRATPLRALRWLPYAAAILLVAAVVGYFAVDAWWPAGGDRELAEAKILPGGNRATLTLSNGRTIDLDETQTGIVVGDQDITYSDGASLGLPPADTLLLTTPKGGAYQVTLSDGSHVWLNAASTLKYPERFAGHERVIEIEGEAYFEIEADPKRPFKVHSGGQTVEVLGTAFNISAYADDPEIKTTLVDGKVQILVSHAEGHQGSGAQLSPGTQSIVRGGSIDITRVDTDQYTSWRSGRFSFENKPFDQLMRELARWYDIDIRYEGPVPDVEFYGGAFRNKNLAVVLRLLESAKLSYRMDGRTLIINTKGEVRP